MVHQSLELRVNHHSQSHGPDSQTFRLWPHSNVDRGQLLLGTLADHVRVHGSNWQLPRTRQSLRRPTSIERNLRCRRRCITVRRTKSWHFCSVANFLRRASPQLGTGSVCTKLLSRLERDILSLSDVGKLGLATSIFVCDFSDPSIVSNSSTQTFAFQDEHPHHQRHRLLSALMSLMLGSNFHAMMVQPLAVCGKSLCDTGMSRWHKEMLAWLCHHTSSPEGSFPKLWQWL